MIETRTCFTCKDIKNTEEFGWRDKSRRIRLGRCRSCMGEYMHQLYSSNPGRRLHVRRQVIRSRQRNTRYVMDYLDVHPCVDCGFSDIRALDFDHLHDKIANISLLRFKGCSLDRLQREIDKCEVRCANCHRIITHERRAHSILDVEL